MNAERFDALLERRIGLIRSVLQTKAAEYATPFGGDRLHNFKRMAEMQRTTPERTGWNLVAKQIVSVQDMIESGAEYSQAQWDEKIGDIVNYMILIEACAVDSKKCRIPF